jgi:hypothetical protein
MQEEAAIVGKNRDGGIRENVESQFSVHGVRNGPTKTAELG